MTANWADFQWFAFWIDRILRVRALLLLHMTRKKNHFSSHMRCATAAVNNLLCCIYILRSSSTRAYAYMKNNLYTFTNISAINTHGSITRIVPCAYNFQYAMMMVVTNIYVFKLCIKWYLNLHNWCAQDSLSHPRARARFSKSHFLFIIPPPWQTSARWVKRSLITMCTHAR